MGDLKQLLPIDGQPMVRRTTERVCAAGLAQVVVVVGAQAEAVEEALVDLPVDVVVNEAWAAGMSTSLRAGLDALGAEIEAVLIVLADQPALTPGLLQTIADGHRRSGAPIVAPVYQGRRGNPVLFDRVLFSELRAVEGDRGGRQVLARHEDEIEWLAVQDPAVVLDVDTRQDYQKVQRSTDQ